MRLRRIVKLMVFLLPASLFLAAGVPLAAQTTSGSIVGAVEDTQGAPVPKAIVTVADSEEGSSRAILTDNLGRFVVPDLRPGRYILTVQSQGFKELVRSDVILNGNTNLSIGTLTLQVGTMSQEVRVVASGEQLQTETAERSESIVGEQLQNIEVNGRSYLALLQLVPGIYNDSDYSYAGVGLGNIYSNGSRGNQANVTFDGAGNVDTGANGSQMATASLDSIQEFKVLTSNYQAQYGRSAGAQISVVSKGGKKKFFGSGYWYHRNESVNANDWINNRDGLPRKIFRANDFGATLGGPIFIPGKFNTHKDKLFFFWSEERQHQFLPENVRNATVPTALERQGDFSQSVDKNGNRFNRIKDPLSGKPCSSSSQTGCFQDGGVLGKIPQNRLYAPGIAILNLFPLPIAASPLNKGYNYQSQVSREHPRREDLIRIDYNISPKWRLYGSYLDNYDSVTTAYGSFRMGSNIPLVPIQDIRPGHVFVISANAVVSPTSTNEVKFDIGHNQIDIRPATDGLTRRKTALYLNTFYEPYQDLIPRFNFGGRINNSPGVNTSNGPFYNYNTTLEWIDNFSKIWNQHFIKAGIYIQRNRKDQDTDAKFNGDYDFSDNGNNLRDTGFGFANAALGIYTSFSQASQFARGKYRYTNLEFYIQDTWRVRPRLTFDYGVRFYWIQPQYDAALQTSNFFPEQWDPAQAPRLYWPAFDSKGQKVGRDLVTGQTVPIYKIGTIVPNSGNLMNGILQPGRGTNKYLIRSPGILAGPRVGLTYDLTGHQNLILRVGAGIYYDRYQGNNVFPLLANPPTAFTPTAENGFMQDVALNSAAVAPSGLQMLNVKGEIPTVYNYSAGFQSKLPMQMDLDLSYVGSVSRHLIVNRNLNAIPYGATFLPRNEDPTKKKQNPNATLGSNAYDRNFLRPMPGYGDIRDHEFSGTSNYNSLQASVKRRFAKGLFLGVAYTWSKCLTVASGDGDYIRIDGLTRLANYGRCNYDVRNNLVINYVYGLPNVAPRFEFLNHAVTRALLNDWQISGVTIFRSGPPYGVGYSIPGVGSPQLTGSYTEGARVKLVGNPLLGTSDSPYARINPAAFAPPDVGSIGMDSPVNYLTKPGTNNWDMSLQKNVSLNERFKLQIRVDAFNAFNHPQFTGVHSTINFSGIVSPKPTNLPFDENGNLVDRNGFGTISGVRNPRTLQLVTRVVF